MFFNVLAKIFIYVLNLKTNINILLSLTGAILNALDPLHWV